MAYKSLKLWFDEELGLLISDRLLIEYSSFPKSKFIKKIKKGVEGLELKDRVELIADLLEEMIDLEYEKKVKLLISILGPENTEEVGMFKFGYWIMPIAKFVEKYGLQHLELSLEAILEITKRNTGEYTIRPYLEMYPKKVSKQMKKWAKNDNFHIRRLACEGIRPRLPWAKKQTLFIEDSKPIFDILNILKDDPIKYVQKSVANNLNDLLKENYEFTIALIKEWSKNCTANRKWIIKHALRNEIKKENQEAIKLINSISG